MATNITFDGFDLQREEIVTTDIVDLQAPDRTLNIGKRGRDDFSTFVSEFYDGKVIRIEGYLTTTTASGLLGLRDNFQQVMSRKQKELDITRDGEDTRRYTATASNVDVRMERAETTQARFVVDFRLSNPFGCATTSVSGSRTQNSMFETQFITISGTYPARPTIVMDVTSGAVGDLRIENTTISGQLLIAPTTVVSGGESVVVDLESFSATINGTEIGTAGVFPRFLPQAEGNNAVLTTVSGHNFEVVFTTEYTPKYI